MTQTTATATAPTTTTAAPARPGRAANIGLWTLQVLTAAVFVFAAIPKITADPMAVAGFAMMGIGPAGMLTIGLLELAGAIAMFIPRLTGLAALCQVALMIGAVTTTLVYLARHGRAARRRAGRRGGHRLRPPPQHRRADHLPAPAHCPGLTNSVIGVAGSTLPCGVCPTTWPAGPGPAAGRTTAG